MKMTESQKVAAAAWRIRRYALQMGEVQGQGYIGQALGYADVLATAFSHAMTYRPEDPEWEGRDRFLLSHGHYAIAYYAALLEAGIIPEAELETYGSDDSRLPMSGMATYTPGMEMSGGSLGQGLSIAVGMALGLRQKQSKAWVYNSMSDGELDEGSTWEAAMSAAHYGLSNLINLVDVNKQQADGDSRKILGFEPLQDKWAAFDNAKSYSGNQPRVILCDTLMGKGVPFLETRDKNHFIRVDADEWQKAIAVLDANKPEGVL
ncbi:transketolase [Klebsiella pneumoniae]|nr:transketolase [Klebsiella pneumoniae]MDH8491082.1 transketolase [Klebsiella pneumoniae]MDH8550054.1 transketolase [Klebsiella pneumoniae]MDH8598161.1 transketolase [Klebsiella pneumoniae]